MSMVPFAGGVNAVVVYGTYAYSFCGGVYLRSDLQFTAVDVGFPQPIEENWHDWPTSWLSGVDAALPIPQSNSVYFFKGGDCLLYDLSLKTTAAGYPKSIAVEFPGMPAAFASGFDAAMNVASTSAHFFKGNQVVAYDYVHKTYIGPAAISGAFFALPAAFQQGIDAAVNTGDCIWFFKGKQMVALAIAGWSETVAHAPRPLSSINNWPKRDNDFARGIDGIWLTAAKAYMFRGDQYLRYDIAADSMDVGFPKPRASFGSGWPADWSDGVDAIVGWPNGKVYAFRDNLYVRFDPNTGAVDPGYPAPISSGWGSWPATWTDGIDAAFVWTGSSGKAYFFHKDQYVRYDIASDKVDPGYPAPISSGWSTFPSDLKLGFDSAIKWNENSAYLFKGKNYIRYHLPTDTMDAGYPAPIASGWGNWPLAVPVTPSEAAFTMQSLLMEDHWPDATNTSLVECRSFRTMITAKNPKGVSPTTLNVYVAAFQAVSLLVRGKVVNIDARAWTAFPLDASGQLAISAKADSLFTTPLMIRVDPMDADHYVPLYADADIHATMSQWQGSDLRPVLPDSLTDAQVEDLASSVRDLIGVVQDTGSTTATTSTTSTTSATSASRAVVNRSTSASTTTAALRADQHFQLALANRTPVLTALTPDAAAAIHAAAVAKFSLSHIGDAITNWVSVTWSSVKKAVTSPPLQQWTSNLLEGGRRIANQITVTLQYVEQGVTKTVNAIVNTVEDAFDFIGRLFKTIAVEITKIIDLLSAMFNWTEMNKTKEAFKPMVLNGLDVLNNNLTTLRTAVKSQLNAARDSFSSAIDNALSHLGTLPIAIQPTTTSSWSGDPQVGWFMNLLLDNLSSSSASTSSISMGTQTTLDTALAGIVTRLQQSDATSAISQLTTQLTSFAQSATNPLAQLPALLTFLKTAGTAILNVTADVVDLILQAASLAITAIKTLLQTTIDIPLVSWFYKTVISNGSALTPLDLGALIAAIPVTIAYRAQHPSSSVADLLVEPADTTTTSASKLVVSDASKSVVTTPQGNTESLALKNYNCIVGGLMLPMIAIEPVLDAMDVFQSDGNKDAEGKLSLLAFVIGCLNQMFSTPGSGTPFYNWSQVATSTFQTSGAGRADMAYYVIGTVPLAISALALAAKKVRPAYDPPMRPISTLCGVAQLAATIGDYCKGGTEVSNPEQLASNIMQCVVMMDKILLSGGEPALPYIAGADAVLNTTAAGLQFGQA